MTSKLDPDRRRAFLLDRSLGLGGTDMPALLGLEPKRNALDIYHLKTRPLPEKDDEQTVDQLRGFVLEDMARRAYFEYTGRRGRAVSGARSHPSYPGFNCHLDYDIFADPTREKEWTRGTGVGETKCPRASVLRSIIDNGIRIATIVQGLTYAAVTERDWCGLNFYSLEWSGGGGHPGPTLPVDVPADGTLGKTILETGSRFWTEHVEKRVPPDPRAFDEIGAKLRGPAAEAVRESTGELVIVADDETGELSLKLLEADDTLKKAKQTRDELYDRMEARITTTCESDRIEVPGTGRFTVVRSDGRRSFSQKALALHRPIDRDKLREVLKGLAHDFDHEPFWPEETGELDELLEELELDLSAFSRTSDPFSFVRASDRRDK